MQAIKEITNPVLMKIVSSYHKTAEEIELEAKQVMAAKLNPRDFRPLYEKYHEQIFRFAYQRTGTKDISFDLSSKIFLKALASLNKYEDRGLPFGAWLFRIAKSEVYQHFRDTQANRTANVDLDSLNDILEEVEEDKGEEQRTLLVKMLEDLGEDDLQLIEMRFFEKRPFKEIGEILEMTENNAKVKVYRIIEKMKKSAPERES